MPRSKPPAPQPKRLASVQAAGIYADCHAETIRRMISDGKLTGYRLGSRLIRVDLNQLDALLVEIPTMKGGNHAA